MSTKLTSFPTLVESPFIIATLGGVTFGSYSGKYSNGGIRSKITYPNFMNSIDITKVNGTVNTYKLHLIYQVRANDDPNLIDKILSKAANSRKITLQYGDWNAPTSIYKEEACIITGVTSSLDMNNSCISYTISCTSDAIGLSATQYDFTGKTAKPSEELRKLLNSPKYGLKQVFTGMTNSNKVLSHNLIASNDKKVTLLPQKCTPISYMNYLVNSMINNNTADTSKASESSYFLTIHDDYSNTLGGTYFKVTEINTKTSAKNNADTYEIDINYPTDNFVTQFSLNDDQSWAILYQYNQDVKQEEYSYTIDDSGNIITSHVPTLMKSRYTNQISATKSAWWTKMTQFPVSATLTIKGLTRPSILMSYVKLNVWFAGGNKHISSGLYVITKQIDHIDASGCRTTLELLRVGGDS